MFVVFLTLATNDLDQLIQKVEKKNRQDVTPNHPKNSVISSQFCEKVLVFIIIPIFNSLIEIQLDI